LLPRSQPDLAPRAALYRSGLRRPARRRRNASCPERLALPTRPVAFSSKPEVSRLSPSARLRRATYGVPGTAMPSFGEALTENERWDLSF